MGARGSGMFWFAIFTWGGMVMFDVMGQKVLVTSPLGTVIGLSEKSVGGKPYAAFRGIPYAKPPTGSRRFMPPERLESWGEKLEAFRDGAECLQMDVLVTLNITGREDCLYLNVFTPITNETENLPVIFFIHGGGFISGSSNSLFYSPGYFMDEDVVLVTFNYRLGPLGFMSTEDKVMPGNMGLLDMIAALQWVQQNIRHFGGDPRAVTIMGESAGAGAVHHLILSPRARGLFRAAISESGSALCPWAVAEGHRRGAEGIASILGCPTMSSADLLLCLQQVPAEAIVGLSTKLWEWQYFPLLFGPRVDRETDGPVLPDEPINMMLEGCFSRVPWLTGINKDEGVLLALTPLGNETALKDLNERWEALCPLAMDFSFTTPVRCDRRSACNQIKTRYFRGKNISQDNASQLIEVFGDRWFKVCGVEAADLHSRFSPTYFYYFKGNGKRKFLDVLFAGPRQFLLNKSAEAHAGVGHGDDLLYLFDAKMIPPITTMEPMAFAIKNAFVRLWTDFATYLDPTPKGKEVELPSWPLYTEKKPYTYIIDAQPIVELGNIGEKRKTFWNSLPIQENNPLQTGF
ncbi:unnamed protein product [Darwinula stevensoni]|uniref:Carboxylic ester hydrolase n=1 Tax=Darwinula stevensoni TaxID=69355 RepID=A0A7R9A192_9CRUS|nr:unnamed protein product [Darwinula stevensoni]CAG0887246.1 unnamed protein product [Darwinula stevensoni]